MMSMLLFLPVHLLRWAAAQKDRIQRWYHRNRPPPWYRLAGTDPLGANAGETDLTFVSRHSLAESGLKCPQCRKEVAERGDFAGVRTSRLGELVICPSCGEKLVAAPDTEHGDHTIPYNAKVMHKFVRISEARALAEKYDGDVSKDSDGSMQSKQRVRLGDLGKSPLEGVSWDSVAKHDDEKKEHP